MKFLNSWILVFAVLAIFTKTASSSEIPVEDFFSDIPYADVVISPTGKYFAIKSTTGISDNILIFDRENKEVITNFTFGEKQVFSSITWVNNERLIFQGRKVEGYLDGSQSSVSWYAANADGSNRRELFQTQRSYMDITHLLPDDPDHILVSKYHFADDFKAKVHRLNVNDGRTYFVSDHPNDVNSVLADNTGTLRAAYGYEVDDDLTQVFRLYYRPLGQDEWVSLPVDEHQHKARMSFIGFAADNRRAFLTGLFETETTAVYELDTLTGDLEMIAHDPVADYSGYVTDGDNHVIAVQFEPDKIRRVYVDETTNSNLLKSLEQAFPGQYVYIRNSTRDNKYAVVRVSSDRNPGEYYLFNTETLQASYIASTRPRLNSEALVPMLPISYTASDDTVIHGYLTMPKADRFGRKPPLLIEVHGGPMGERDQWGFSSYSQFLASRGIAVLQVNFRGSGGYGYEFQRNGYRQWGERMQQDLYDATAWAVEQGYTDANRICISGGSYGAYAALLALAQKPDLYQCAVGRGGAYSLPLLLSSTDGAGNELTRAYFARQMGDDMDALEAVSPVTHAEKITKPVLLMHGRNDVRTPFSQYEVMLDALNEHDKNVTTWVHDGGHSVYTQEDRYIQSRKIIDFLAKHLAIRQ
ncbi:MAG TPA: prolyl oligopeptidase family serine peptidase [Pseudidiomarina sp.]|nr:prolyl oligopeptidase family serine peptidase [Pseudidiomarina sp.]